MAIIGLELAKKVAERFTISLMVWIIGVAIGFGDGGQLEVSRIELELGSMKWCERGLIPVVFCRSDQ